MKTFTLTHARDGNVHTVLFSAPDFETAAREVLAMKEERGIRPIAVKERVPESWAGRAAMWLGAMVVAAVIAGPTVREVWESGGSFGRILHALVPVAVCLGISIVARIRAQKSPFPTLNSALDSSLPVFNGKARMFMLVGLVVGVLLHIIGVVDGVRQAGESEMKLMQTAVLGCLLGFMLMGIGEMWPKAPKQE